MMVSILASFLPTTFMHHTFLALPLSIVSEANYYVHKIPPCEAYLCISNKRPTTVCAVGMWKRVCRK